MKRSVWLIGLAAIALLVSGPAWAQAPGECTGGMCGTPDESGGAPCVGVCAGCGCGCGSILIANTDLGDTYQYADDYDEDGIEDDFDNCPFIPNQDQSDSDGDTVGNACDNCINLANLLQRNADGDELGDDCDPDIDGDSVENTLDNCPQMTNPTQLNTDADQLGDACDPDIDDDGWLNLEDNCPFVSNPQQLDTDPNMYGDACNSDQDFDGVADFADNCPLTANSDQVNTDGDLMGDLCDADMDDDGMLNHGDNCPKLANYEQADMDRDGLGDVCDNSFCFVVDKVDACLDPTAPFAVYAGADKRVRTGDLLPMLLWSNRKNRAIEYEWSVVSRPEGSRATLKHPRGSATLSTPYQYHYKMGRQVEFVPDHPGVYTIKLNARLVFADTLYPDKQLASHEMQLTAEGEALGSGCSTTSGGVGALSGLFLLLGSALLLRRRD